MKKPAHTVEIFLHQGEVCFGDRHACIRTVLGSCVAITMWHADLLLGGMCHYMLPARRKGNPRTLDGKYADEALVLMLDKIRQAGSRPTDYQIKLFGGGNMLPGQAQADENHVGMKNVEIGRELLTRHGLPIHVEHLGGKGHRNLIFNIWSGDVWVRQQPMPPSPGDYRGTQEPCQPL